MMYGIGSVYESTEEKLPQFVSSGVACVGWDRNDAPPLHQLLAKIGVGDIIFAKSYPPSSGLHIKAVGIVNSPEIFNVPNLGYGRSVSWIWSSQGGSEPIHIGPVNDRYDNMRRGTLYEELGPVVQQRVLGIVLGRQSASRGAVGGKEAPSVVRVVVKARVAYPSDLLDKARKQAVVRARHGELDASYCALAEDLNVGCFLLRWTSAEAAKTFWFSQTGREQISDWHPVGEPEILVLQEAPAR